MIPAKLKHWIFKVVMPQGRPFQQPDRFGIPSPIEEIVFRVDKQPHDSHGIMNYHPRSRSFAWGDGETCLPIAGRLNQ